MRKRTSLVRSLILCAGVVMALGTLCSPGSAAAEPITIIDSLGDFSRDERVMGGGTFGLTIGRGHSSGPEFSISKRAVITSIGAFVNNSACTVDGVPLCPDT